MKYPNYWRVAIAARVGRFLPITVKTTVINGRNTFSPGEKWQKLNLGKIAMKIHN